MNLCAIVFFNPLWNIDLRSVHSSDRMALEAKRVPGRKAKRRGKKHVLHKKMMIARLSKTEIKIKIL